MWRLQQDERRGPAEAEAPGALPSTPEGGALPRMDEAPAAAAAATLRSGS
jgi:hypothetical protein